MDKLVFVIGPDDFNGRVLSKDDAVELERIDEEIFVIQRQLIRKMDERRAHLRAAICDEQDVP